MAQQHSRLQVGLILGSFESQPRDAEAPWDRPELATTAEESRWAVRGHGSRGKGKDRSHGGGGGVQRAENSNGERMRVVSNAETKRNASFHYVCEQHTPI